MALPQQLARMLEDIRVQSLRAAMAPDCGVIRR